MKGMTPYSEAGR